MKTSSDAPTALFDTNVLVYAANSSAPQHTEAKAAREEVLRGKVIGCVTPQILFEYFATVTSGKRISSPVPPDRAPETSDQAAKAGKVRKAGEVSVSGGQGGARRARESYRNE